VEFFLAVGGGGLSFDPWASSFDPWVSFFGLGGGDFDPCVFLFCFDDDGGGDDDDDDDDDDYYYYYYVFGVTIWHHLYTPPPVIFRSECRLCVRGSEYFANFVVPF